MLRRPCLRSAISVLASVVALSACGSDDGGGATPPPPSGTGGIGNVFGGGGNVSGGGMPSGGGHAGFVSGGGAGGAHQGGQSSGGVGGASGGAGTCVDPSTLPKTQKPTLDVSSTCSPIASCNGNVDGTKWVLASTCVPDSVIDKDADAKVQSVCPTAYGTDATTSVQGSLRFAAGTMTLHLHASTSKIYTLPNDCSFCQCSQMESMLISAGLYNASCSPQCSNGDCSCFVDGSFDEDVTEGYTAGGGKITTPSGKSFDVCATSTLLSLSEGTSSSNRHSATFAPPSPEVCNGVDDDANGMVDDHPIDCPPCKHVGVCASGVKATCAGSWQCTYSSPAWEPTEQTCDGLDNDCNGVVDDPIATSAACVAKNGPGSVCVNGACSCSKTTCAGKCVDTDHDSTNCGACGNVCGGATPSCIAGACACPSPAMICNGQCVDVTSSPDHCGSCANKCATGQSCQSGQCGCPGGQASCGTQCVFLASDPANCGSCGNACTGGKTCQSAQCVCPSGSTDCNGTCATLLSDAKNCGSCGHDCGPGVGCMNGQCGCLGGLVYCGGMCVATSTDSNNCGGCGIVCSGGKSCSNGTCQCNAAFVDCGGTCVNEQSDPSNCGSCGNVCPAGQLCNLGQCGCQTGLTDCAGTCVDTMTDATDCGACGKACASTQTCSNGACVCKTGLTQCSAGCVNLQTDSTNCGQCGVTCVGMKTCQAGFCK